MKHGLIMGALLATVSLLNAQDAAPEEAPEGPWKKGGIGSLNFSQTYLSNWQGGGQSAINGTVLLSLYANYAENNWTWDNSFDAAYGQTLIGELSTPGNVFQKTDDRVEITSKLGRKTPLNNTFWATMATFRTQWDAGYDYGSTPFPLISDPFAPAYVLIGTGIDYEPSEAFSIDLSPITSKITIVDNQRLANAGAFGVTAAEYDAAGNIITEGEMVRFEIGGLLKLQYTKEILENVQLTTRADFFANYLENVGNIDVNWETLIAMKINKYLTASLTTHLIYDDDIKVAVDRSGDGVDDGFGPRIQFKEVFGLGLSHQFNQ